MKRLFVAIMCTASVVLGVQADEVQTTPVVWTNLAFTSSNGNLTHTSSNTAWGVVGNWTDENGAALTVAPTNVADNFAVTLAEIGTTSASPYHKCITTGYGSSKGTLQPTAVNPSIYSVTGGERYTIRHAPVDNGIVQDPGARIFNVVNPNGFYGAWETESVLSRIQLSGADGTFTPILRYVTAQYQSRIGVPEGGTGRIDVLDGNGGIWRIGNGNLEIGTTSGGGNSLMLDSGTGTLKLEGVKTDGSDLSALLDRAAFHLDATVDASLVKSNGDDRVYVTRWNDCRANGKYAYVPTSGFDPSATYIKMANAPFVSTDTTPTGKHYIDFGSQDATVEAIAKYGPTNCMMRFEADENVREVFYVARYRQENPNVAILSSGNYPFHPQGGTGRILHYTYASYFVKSGDLRLNGRRVECYDYPRADELTSFHVFSSGTTGNVKLSQMGTDREYARATGGCCIAEVLIFDEPLTVAERVSINRYLRGKWMTGENYAQMFGPVISRDAATIEVPEGQTARIETLRMTGDSAARRTLTKKGDGILEIGCADAVAKIVIEGGEVRLPPASVTSVPTEPVEGALYWLDASKADHFEYDSEGHISKWKDQRTGAVVGTSYKGKSSTINPTLVENAYGTLSAVSFGTKGSGSSTASCMRFPNWRNYDDDDAQSRTGFIVFRFNGYDSDASFFCSGSSNIDAMRNYRRIAATETAYPRTRVNSAHWTLNGSPIEPMVSTTALMAQDTFFVVAFDSDLGQYWQGLAADRDENNGPGGVTIGEVILYNRRLTAAEKRANEAYLMNKWLGQAHPASADPTPTYQFGDDVAVAVESAGDVTLAKAMGNGSIYKAGSGTLTIPTDSRSFENREAVAVDGGTLHTDFAHSYTIDGKKPYFHFDATRLDRMTWYSEDGIHTNVTQVKNTYNSTLLGTSKGSTGNAVTNPALTWVEMRTGLMRPCWDFGLMNNKNAPITSDSSSAFHNTHGTSIKEFHVIFADRLATKNPSYQHVFTSHTSGYYKRDSLNLLAETAPSYAKTGYLAIDGLDTSYNTPIPTGFHLISGAPNNEGYVNMTTPNLARSNAGCGGCQIAEYIAYNGSATNTALERAYVQEYLMNKWFGAPAPRMQFPIDTVTIAANATWEDTSDAVRFRISDFTLLGSASIADLLVTDAMTVEPGAETSGNIAFEADAELTLPTLSDVDEALTVGGTFTVPKAGLTVNVLPELEDGRVAPGTYLLFKAEGFATKGQDAFSLDDFHFTYPTCLTKCRRVTPTYDAETKTISLTISKMGTTIIFK